MDKEEARLMYVELKPQWERAMISANALVQLTVTKALRVMLLPPFHQRGK